VGEGLGDEIERRLLITHTTSVLAKISVAERS
jgi:hypothetical protein